MSFFPVCWFQKVLYVFICFSFHTDTQDWMISTVFIFNRSLSGLLLMMTLTILGSFPLHFSPELHNRRWCLYSIVFIPISRLAICLGKAFRVQQMLSAHLRSKSLFIPVIIMYKIMLPSSGFQLSVPQPIYLNTVH